MHSYTIVILVILFWNCLQRLLTDLLTKKGFLNEINFTMNIYSLLRKVSELCYYFLG